MRELDKWHVSAAAANAVLDSIISYMERHGKIAAPTGVVDDGPVLDALCGCGLIVTDGSQLTFTPKAILITKLQNAWWARFTGRAVTFSSGSAASTNKPFFAESSYDKLSA